MKTLLIFLAAARLLSAQERPAAWAQPVTATGLPNFHRVTETVYRSAQPWAEGFRAVEKMGIRTVISLRDDVGDEEFAAGTKLRLVRVPVTLAGINDDAVLRVLAELEKKENGPFLVHCQMGADRTGAVMAMHRIVVQGWKREDALREMREGGFHFGIEAFARYVESADIARLRAALAAMKAR